MRETRIAHSGGSWRTGDVVRIDGVCLLVDDADDTSMQLRIPWPWTRPWLRNVWRDMRTAFCEGVTDALGQDWAVGKRRTA